VPNGDPINTTDLGSHSFTVTATNAAGPTANTVSYTVAPPPTSAPPTPPPSALPSDGPLVTPTDPFASVVVTAPAFWTATPSKGGPRWMR